MRLKRWMPRVYLSRPGRATRPDQSVLSVMNKPPRRIRGTARRSTAGYWCLSTSLKIRSNFPGVFRKSCKESPTKTWMRPATPAPRKYSIARRAFSTEGFAGLEDLDLEAGDVARFLTQGFGRAGEDRERSVVHGHDVLYAEEAYGVGGFTRTHGIEIADGQTGHVRAVEFADELHVAENSGITGVVQREAAGHANDVAGRFAGVDPHAIVFDRARMEGVGHDDFEVADPLRAAFAHRTGLFFKALGPDPQSSLKN